MNDKERVMKAAMEILMGISPNDMATFWYSHIPLEMFHGKTAAQLVEEGRANDVIDFLDSIEAGFTG